MTPGAVAQLSKPLAKLIARIDYAEPMRRRGVQDAILAASAWTWRRRAELFDWARPRAGDYTGNATVEELTGADERCAGTALACREHAAALEAGWFQ